jgi:hyperosmotically inducible periplasmic protein
MTTTITSQRLTRRSPSWIKSSCLAAMVSFSAHAQEQTNLVDARQEAQITTTYALSPYLRANDIKVSVNGGKALLTGIVDDDVVKDLAKQIALGVDGITAVDNQIAVQQDYIPRPTTKNYGRLIDDATLTAAVRSRLAWSKQVDSQHLQISSLDGRVVLSGSQATQSHKDAAQRLTQGTRGVISVDNQIQVNDKTSSNSSQQTLSDAWITTKIKSSLLYAQHIDSNAIEVTTQKGVVTLKGTATSPEEKALAVELTQNIRGVNRVVSSDLMVPGKRS